MAETSIVGKHFLKFLNQDNGFNQEFPKFHYENRLFCAFSCKSKKKENKWVLKMIRITQTSHIKSIDKEFSKITGIPLITNEQG